MSLVPEKRASQPVTQQRGSYAVVAITKNGAAVARKLGKELPGADVYLKCQHHSEDDTGIQIRTFEGSVGLLLPKLFPAYKRLILIFSLGAVVRLIAPYLQDKKRDPAVVVVDEQAKHAISVLSGHLGGANALTLKVADLLNAHPVS